MRALAAIAILAVGAGAAPARADGGYADRVIEVDATTDAILVVGLVSDQDWMLVAGVVAYGLGGPLVHGAHDHWGRAGVSLATRVVTPVVGAVIGTAGCRDDRPMGCIGAAAVGAGIGALIAQAVDATAIVPGDDPTPVMLTVGGRF